MSPVVTLERQPAIPLAIVFGIGAVPMKFTTLANEVMKLRDDQGIRGYERELSRMRCHILTAAFPDKEIETISAPDIREWLRWMAQRDAIVHKDEEPRKLSRATIGRCQSLVSAVFVEAIERELIQLNPCQGVKQKKKLGESDTVDDWAYLTLAEQQRIAACESIDIADRLAIRFAIGTGLRQGEQFNLELIDLRVDGAKPVVIVRYSNRHKGKKSPPKSGKRRTVPLMGDALVAAREWLAMLPTFAPSNPHGLVFPSPRGCIRQQGKPLAHSHDRMRDLYKKASVPHRKGLHWHALRHTFASNLISGVVGKPLRLQVVQILLGHSTVAMTERYAHLGEDEVMRAIREADLAGPAPEAEDTAATLVPLECMPEAPDTETDLEAMCMADEASLDA